MRIRKNRFAFIAIAALVGARGFTTPAFDVMAQTYDQMEKGIESSGGSTDNRYLRTIR
jgi:hypothetical protein